MKIGLFVGTFDPIHMGHIKTCEHVKNQLKLDKMIIVPNYKVPHKELTSSFDHRYRMCQLATSDFDIEVSDFECKNKVDGYGLETLKYFSSLYEEVFYIMGSDVFMSIPYWDHKDEFLSLVTVVVARRNEHVDYTNVLDIISTPVVFCSAPVIPLASSHLKSDMESHTYFNGVPQIVRDYIKENNLYKRD